MTIPDATPTTAISAAASQADPNDSEPTLMVGAITAVASALIGIIGVRIGLSAAEQGFLNTAVVAVAIWRIRHRVWAPATVAALQAQHQVELRTAEEGAPPTKPKR